MNQNHPSTFWCEACQEQRTFTYDRDHEGARGRCCDSCQFHYRLGYVPLRMMTDEGSEDEESEDEDDIIQIDRDLGRVHDVRIPGNPVIVIIDEYARERRVRLGALLSGMINLIAELDSENNEGYPFTIRDLVNLAARFPDTNKEKQSRKPSVEPSIETSLSEERSRVY